MKRLLIGVGFVFFTSEVVAQSFRIDGQITDVKDKIEYIYLSYADDNKRVNDSVRVKDGKYSFKGNLSEPVLARLRPRNSAGPLSSKREITEVFLQPGQIKITHKDSFSNTRIIGSAAHAEYLGLEEKLKPVKNQMNELMAEYSRLSKAKDEDGLKKLESRHEELSAKIKDVYSTFLSENSHSSIAMYALAQVAGWDIDPAVVEPLFNNLPESIRKLPSAVTMKEKIGLAKLTAVGNPAPEFTQKDTLGKPVSLSSFKGKYILIDFWASWCGPCRQENPNLVSAFRKYKDKGFHVIGISLDQPAGKDKWIKAIHDDQLWWTQLSDLQFWKNEVAVQYGIQAIPQNLLLNRDGIIIGKNLRGEKLQEKLAEIFN